VPPSTAEIICDDDGTLSIVAPLQSQSGEHAARQDLLYGYMNHDAESIQLYGRIPAKLDEKNGEVRGHWNQRVLTVKQGTFTAPLFARTTYENKLAHHEVPLRYIPASSFPCQAGTCKSFRAVWHATTDLILNESVSHTLYVDSDSGLSELTLRDGDVLEPMVLHGTLGGNFDWKPQKALVLNTATPLRFRFDVLSNVVPFDQFGQPLALGDGTVQSLDKTLNYSRAYLELTTGNLGGVGDRAYWLGPVELCPPGDPNYCLGGGEIPDCSGNCHPESDLYNGVCNDGQDGGANFNCFKYEFDGCKPPVCPTTDFDIDLHDAGLLELAYQRDCNQRCISRVLYGQTVLDIPIVGNGVCDNGKL
jgi:hypothetical protein